MKGQHETASAPQWDLRNVFAGLGSGPYNDAKERLRSACSQLLESATQTPPEAVDEVWIARFVGLYNETGDLHAQLEAYAYACFSVDTNNDLASKELNRLSALELPRKKAIVAFRNTLAHRFAYLAEDEPEGPELREHLFFLREQLVLQRHQMPPAQEEIAADLSRAGGDAWSRLQESASSNLTALWDESSGEQKTVNDLRSLAFSPERDVREKAYRLELSAWEGLRIPFAYAINGVKGFSTTLNERRGFRTAVEPSLLASRITPETIESLIAVMTESLPVFRRYLKAKGRSLGVQHLRFYDLFAPVGASPEPWSFERARDFIVEQFAGFSDGLAGFARRAFDGMWIDAERRKGKVGGAYCVSFPLAKESRILCNFDGSFSAVSTIAHELGHAYHHHVLREETFIHRAYPMTMAETASIFCQTIVFNAALDHSATSERAPIIEEFLQDATQVVVDILSRYLFESALFERRSDAELSPDELCELMLDAQRRTYGDAMDPDYLHPYMWAVKGHYYIQDLPFYNYPYAFGMLFALALYDRYAAEGERFVPVYDSILSRTGRDSANGVTASAGFDIEKKDFWRSGIAVIERYAALYEELAG